MLQDNVQQAKHKKGHEDFTLLANAKPIPAYYPLTYEQFLEFINSHKVGRHEVSDCTLSTTVLEALTPSEIVDLKALFEQQDSNGDGLLTLSQFKQALSILSLSVERELQETLYQLYCSPGGLLDIDGFLSTVTRLQDTKHNIMDAIRAVFSRMLMAPPQLQNNPLNLKDDNGLSA
ncbi:unnamed protein product [Dibothriocephalus latus]|uniref:EF-hand domain-containing protein n=1 Tax=Dibothriocephalus latus TaxID=60516 RepID=A0A3P7P1Q7_DIBLA|nr:unnamed protein product [Dibothriocephalus latus]